MSADKKWRLSFHCLDCGDLHAVEGQWPNICLAVQRLLQEGGVTQILIEDAAAAAIFDQDIAEHGDVLPSTYAGVVDHLTRRG